MIKTILQKVNELTKKSARELAEKEGLGYVEAEWLQGQEIEFEPLALRYLVNIQDRGCRVEDLKVSIFISSQGKWYHNFRYSISNPYYGDSLSANIYFPFRDQLEEAFKKPFLDKEKEEQLVRAMQRSLDFACRKLAAMEIENEKMRVELSHILKGEKAA